MHCHNGSKQIKGREEMKKFLALMALILLTALSVKSVLELINGAEGNIIQLN